MIFRVNLLFSCFCFVLFVFDFSNASKYDQGSLNIAKRLWRDWEREANAKDMERKEVKADAEGNAQMERERRLWRDWEASQAKPLERRAWVEAVEASDQNEREKRLWRDWEGNQANDLERRAMEGLMEANEENQRAKRLWRNWEANHEYEIERKRDLPELKRRKRLWRNEDQEVACTTKCSCSDNEIFSKVDHELTTSETKRVPCCC
uniref:U-scoloptoxin(08)-Cw1a n=1 Tax=Cormocephalus westwoodi TaxID=1096223 RepID=TX81A_CORWE|nr:RecName: Full=U-scoloptoxin(08)-Cw1a; Short=U-SLPTX(08)-Cw1a; AltName: Full=U-SLPTX-Cw1a; Flags: Precursor [Cormocephalus westwoodi]AHY22613.1 U-SLPTX-Cw1a [Cormocephalus westwoodi]